MINETIIVMLLFLLAVLITPTLSEEFMPVFGLIVSLSIILLFLYIVGSIVNLVKRAMGDKE